MVDVSVVGDLVGDEYLDVVVKEILWICLVVYDVGWVFIEVVEVVGYWLLVGVMVVLVIGLVYVSV